jgi:hypothetical protein
MKVTLESTSQIVQFDGAEARVWEGETDSGIKVTAFVTRVAVDKDDDTEQFERELKEQRAPTVYWPLRMVL